MSQNFVILRAVLLFAISVQAGAASLAFSSTFGDDMVLQQAPAKAVVYGTISNAHDGVVVTVLVTGNSTSQNTSATVDGTGNWTAILEPTVGTDYTVTASCTGCDASITLQRVAFGDVWYCSGQSNMALPLEHTFGRNESEARIKAGHYAQLRISGMKGNMNPEQPWSTLKAAVQAGTFLSFSSTCYYFGERLSDNLGEDHPIGLIHTAWGGSRIEQWMERSTIKKCKKATIDDSNQEWWDTRVLPYSRMTLKGFVWYQGENNMHALFGSSLLGSGYSCLMVHLVAEWRRLWSTTPGTTDPMAPFGLVTLAPTGGEGGNDIGTMRWAQTGGYGVLPNPAMPNTFLAQAYDLNDPFANITCYKNKCCNKGRDRQPGHCGGCEAYCASSETTKFFMGPIHPRDKRPVGDRLADAASSIAYGLHDVHTGPTLSGCRLNKDNTLTITFNATLLGQGGEVEWRKYQPGASKLHVLVNKKLWCMQTTGGKKDEECIDNGNGKDIGTGAFDDPATWVAVDFVKPRKGGGNTVTADLSNAHGQVYGVRYAWQGSCCSENAPTSDPCPIASCPLMSKPDNLPANPFMAKIVNGKCECLAPQVCDE